MINTLKQMTQLKAALWVNAFLYYFKRLWLIGRYVPDSVYSNYGVKKVLSVLAVVVRQLIDFCGKPLYLLSVVTLPLLLILNQNPELKGREFLIMVQILFFLNGCLGALGDSQIFAVTRDKIVCIKYIHMNAAVYIRAALAFKYIPFFLYYLPWLLVFSRLAGGTLWQGFCLWLLLVSLRMMGEAAQLLIFDRTGKVLSRNMAYSWVLIVIGLAGAYLTFAFGGKGMISPVLIHPVSVLVITLLGGVCLWYITAGYGGYERKFHRSIDINYLFSNLIKASSGTSAAFKEVEIKDKDMAISEADKEKFQYLKGYAYLNALFFARHKRQLIKPVCYRLAMTAALFAGAVVLWIVNRDLAVRLSENMTAMLPSFIFIMYFMTVADKASRAMFYNCDKDLLHYAWYRKPETILKNFQIRFLRVSLYDLFIAGAVCAAAAGFRLLCRGNVLDVDLLLFCTAILLLSVLFTVHHLCLYYIFQPYSENLKVKNPFFSVLNNGMYVLCFMCLQIEVGGFAFTMTVLCFTVIYILAALVIVYRRAPATFRVK